jgi:hypothetical protein
VAKICIGIRTGLRVQKLLQRNRERVGFLAGRTARHPDSDRVDWRSSIDDLGEDARLQLVEHLRVAEKAGHVDEQIVIQRVDLADILL